MMLKKPFNKVYLASAIASLFPLSSAHATDGHILHGVGSINQSMGGAGIATSIDAIGSSYNNVSSISFLKKGSIEFGAELFVPDRSLSSSVVTPYGEAEGTVHSKSRESIIPSIGLAYHIDPDWTFGFTALGIGGFGVDYPANQPNNTGQFSPISTPQKFGGFGSIYSNYQLLQMTPSIAYKVTPDLSVGLGYNIDWASLAVNPWPATPPNASGYPNGSQNATAWGQGFTVGSTYQALDNLALGVSFKSPQWFNKFGWNAQYPDGDPASFNYQLDYPLIVGGGASYLPVEDLTLALDLKWINYSGTRGFEQSNFARSPTGPYVKGFGWEDIFAVALGSQYKVTKELSLRAGYNYADNPIPGNQQFFNVFAPAIVQHHLTVGAGYDITTNLGINLAYYHGFNSEKTGPFISSGAPGYPPINTQVPGTSVTNSLTENSGSLQVTYKFD